MAVSERVHRLVAALHGNRCAYPACSIELIAREGELSRYIGEHAHIRSPKAGGPRHDPLFPVHRLDEEENLLAACAIHHNEFDSRVDLWPVERLLDLRERAHARRKFTWKHWLPELSGIHFVNVPRLVQLAAIEGVDLPLPQHPPGINRGLYPTQFLYEVTRLLPRLEMNSVRLTPSLSFGHLSAGVPVTFSRGVRTKNGPRPPGGRFGTTRLTGRLERDPYIYMARDGWRITIPYDPTWLTTNTAFVDMSAGHVHLAGAFIIKRRLAAADEFLSKPPRAGHLIATPLVFGFSTEPHDSDLLSHVYPEMFESDDWDE